MEVLITKLRSAGKKLPKDQLPAPLQGNLELIHYQGNTRSYAYARLSIHHELGKVEDLAGLYEPRLVALKGDLMVLEGYEQVAGGFSVMQSWRVEVRNGERP